MSKSVLVICSSPTGRDYLDNQDLLHTLLGKEFVPTFLDGVGKTFPNDLPSGENQFDLVFFAGCNHLSSLFTASKVEEREENKVHEATIRRLGSLLKKDGKIIFSESANYVKRHGEAGHGLTLPIEGLTPISKVHTKNFYNTYKVDFSKLIDYWKGVFRRNDSGIYVAYSLKPAEKNSKVSVSGMSGTSAEELCTTLLSKIKDLPSKTSFSGVIAEIKAFIVEKKLKINLVEKKGAKQKVVNASWTNIRSVGDPCKALCDILESGEDAAEIRLKKILALAKSANTTRKKSAQASAVEEFNPADPKNRKLDALNAKIGADLAAEYTAAVEENPLIKMGYPGKIKPDAAIFTCEAFDFSLECLNADGKNSDCFVHSFLLTTCPNFRAAKIKSTAYLTYATKFRTTILPNIVEFVFAQPDFVPESREFDAKAIKADLLTASEFLSDDLIKAVCYYYDICMVIIGPGNPRVSRVLYSSAAKAGSYPPAYVISNVQGAHWEPVRMIGTGQYLLEPEQVECVVKTYSGSAADNEDTVARERAFKELDKIKKMAPDAIAAYIAVPENKPGQVTELFIAGNERIRVLEALKDRLVKHYKNTGGYAKPESWQKRSEDLIEEIKDEQINELNEDQVDMEGITKKVEAFIAPPQKKGRAVPKKGGRRTKRLQRRA